MLWIKRMRRLRFLDYWVKNVQVRKQVWPKHSVAVLPAPKEHLILPVARGENALRLNGVHPQMLLIQTELHFDGSTVMSIFRGSISKRAARISWPPVISVKHFLPFAWPTPVEKASNHCFSALSLKHGVTQQQSELPFVLHCSLVTQGVRLSANLNFLNNCTTSKLHPVFIIVLGNDQAKLDHFKWLFILSHITCRLPRIQTGNCFLCPFSGKRKE